MTEAVSVHPDPANVAGCPTPARFWQMWDTANPVPHPSRCCSGGVVVLALYQGTTSVVPNSVP
jgi:hypothetical protein